MSSVMGTAYDLRPMIFGFSEASEKSSNRFTVQDTSAQRHDVQSERLATVNSGPHYEAVTSFQLIWWNQGSNSRKKLSIWRPVVPHGMVYFGDIAINRYMIMVFMDILSLTLCLCVCLFLLYLK